MKIQIDKTNGALSGPDRGVWATLNEKMDAINSIKADIEEAKRDLRKAMQDAADLRERVYSYLVGELPEGPSDPKLIDYGLRSRFAGPRGQTVTVVNEEELVTEPVPVPEGE